MSSTAATPARPFFRARDHKKFLDYLETATDRFAMRIHTYCLMTHHNHLLVET